MGWFKWKRTTGVEPRPSPPPAAEPETDLQCFARWWRYWAAMRAQQEVAHVEQVRQEDAQRAQRAARERDRIMSSMARNGGSWFPGDEADLPRAAEFVPLESDGGEAGGEAGPWYGLIRWPR
jgi:hypothetical protein